MTGGPFRVETLDPAADLDLCVRLLTLQRAAYAVEARLIGDDRIPPLHETLDALRSAGLRWVGVHYGENLVAAAGFTQTDIVLDIERLVVDPARARQGLGRALVLALIERAADRELVVATGRANDPAVGLYTGLGFTRVEDAEVLPGLWITRLSRRRPVGFDERSTSGATDRVEEQHLVIAQDVDPDDLTEPR